MSLRVALSLNVFSGIPDPANPEGYREIPRLQERLAAVSKLKNVKGIEIEQTDVTPDVPVKELKRMIKDYGLICSSVSASLTHDRRFALGGFGHQHQKTRNAAIDEGRKAVDIAKELGCSEVTVRLHTDGFDYPFQIDYTQQWNTVISSIKTIAKYASPEVNVAIAYKTREPRKHLTVGTVGKSLSLCQEIAMKNVGVAMNFSHALMAGENPGESVAFLTRAGKLFGCYMSDSYRLWDDNLVPGTVHTWELLEVLFYLKTTKYKGFVTIDITPHRMDPSHACQIALGNLSIFWKKLDKLDSAELRKAQKTLDAVESQKIIRRVMLQA